MTSSPPPGKWYVARWIRMSLVLSSRSDTDGGLRKKVDRVPVLDTTAQRAGCDDESVGGSKCKSRMAEGYVKVCTMRL